MNLTHVVFTGFRDEELKQFIESKKGTVGTSITNSTTLVVFDKDGKSSKKLQEARERAIPMIELQEFKVAMRYKKKPTKRCPEGKERNPKTGRCIKKCPEGKVRVYNTTRCVNPK
jgi:hypothetical protein